MTRLYSPSSLGPSCAGRGGILIVLIGIPIEANAIEGEVIAGNGSADLGGSP
jgi:hypothetical protein